MRINDISKESDNQIPAELREVEQRLREDRPALTAPELEGIKARAKKKSATGSSNKLLGKQKGTLMKSRLALLTILTLGVFMLGTGATVAVSSAASGSAGSAQYEPDEHEFCEETGGSEGAGAEGCDHPCEESGSGSAGESGDGCDHPCEENGSGSAGESGSGEAKGCIHPEPEESTGGTLPYTGFPVVPALLVGLGLLGGGVAMRVRMRSGGNLA
jgi:hypothetical protein